MKSTCIRPNISISIKNYEDNIQRNRPNLVCSFSLLQIFLMQTGNCRYVLHIMPLNL